MPPAADESPRRQPHGTETGEQEAPPFPGRIAGEFLRPVRQGRLLVGFRGGGIDAGPAAVRWRSGFKPDADFQEAEIERIFRSSDGAVTYLGDWHSHPTAPAVPSKPDRRTLRRIATDPDAQCPMPTMLILEQDEFELWSAAGWIGYLGRLGRWGRMTVSLMRIRTFASLR